MTSQEISLIASGLVAFALELIPWFKRPWDKLNGVQKQAIIAVIVILAGWAVTLARALAAGN